MRAEGNIGSYCDRCGEYLNPFTKYSFEVRQYRRGENYVKVSSDIITKTKHFMDLCPDCALEFLDVVEDFKQEDAEEW